MRRYLPALLLGLASIAPLFGCDLLKPKETLDAGALVLPTATATETAATAAATTAGAVPVAPLTPGAAPLTPGATAVATATAHPVDAGAKPADAAVAPTPATTIPIPVMPGFDAGLLKGIKMPDGGALPWMPH